jgi:hypothetical protein
VTLSLHYFRLLYSFNNTPPPKAHATDPDAPASPFHPPAAGFQAKRDDYVDKNAANMVARWNGNDDVNTVRAEYIPKTATDKVKGRVMLFVQPMATALAAHFNLQVVRPGAGLLHGRSWMQGVDGTGELNENALKPEPEPGFAAGSYVAAHELGHGYGLPDEYNERAASFSLGELSFQQNTPGDPFETDGADLNPGGTNGAPDAGIMNALRLVRNRYFWHSAEFAAAIIKVRFLVKYIQDGDTFDKYEVPPHELVPPQAAPAAPRRNYVYWPIQEKIDDTAGAHGKYDLLLYAMGEDRFTKNVVIRAPIDGTLVMAVKMLINFDPAYLDPSATVPTDNLGNFLGPMRRKIHDSFADKFFATGKVRVGTPQEWEFKRCIIRLQPRFLVQNLQATATGTEFTDLLNTGPHITVNVNNAAAPAARWAAAGRTLTLETNASNGGAAAQLAALFEDKFAEMLGFANAAAITAASLKPYVQKVITSNGDAGAF